MEAVARSYSKLTINIAITSHCLINIVIIALLQRRTVAFWLAALKNHTACLKSGKKLVLKDGVLHHTYAVGVGNGVVDYGQ